MTTQEQKLRKMNFLHETIERCLKREPVLSEKEIAQIIVWEMGDISKLLKEIKKEIKKT